MNYNNELAKFKNYLMDRASPGTARVYTHCLSLWFRYLSSNKPSQVTAQSYIDKVKAEGKSPSTIYIRASAIIRWFKFKGKQITLDCPTLRIKEPEYLTLDEIETLLDDCTTVLEDTLITALFDTAVRISELLNLELTDINRGGLLISVIRKGGRRQEVNISAKAMAALDKWLSVRKSESKRVFMDLSYYDAWSILRAVGRKAGIRVHPHIFRHSRAVHMLMNGAELLTVKEHLGHVNIATTANIYGRFKAVHLKELVPSW